MSTPGLDRQSSIRAWLDVRAREDFVRAHLPHSANIPLEELQFRVHELPPRSAPLTIVDVHPSRIRDALAVLASRGYDAIGHEARAQELSQTGTARVVLWKPSPVVEQLVSLVESTHGSRPVRCADLGCGSGRDATYLAMRGWEVDGFDILRDALVRARALATECAVKVNWIVADLRKPIPVELAAYSTIIAVRFQNSAMFAQLARCCTPGTIFAIEAFAQDDAKSRARPGREIVTPGTILQVFHHWRPLVVQESIEREGRRFTQLILQKD